MALNGRRDLGYAPSPRSGFEMSLLRMLAFRTEANAAQAAPAHPHHAARASFITVDGVVQPAPAPRFSATPNATPAAHDDAFDAREWALAWGVDVDALQALD